MSNSEFSFQGILFDMDGLLIDSERLSYQSFCSTALAYDISLTMDDYRQMIGLNHVTGLGVLRQLLPSSLDPASQQRRYRSRRPHFRRATPLRGSRLHPEMTSFVHF